MSKVSVFKFDTNNTEENLKNIIHGYLNSRGLIYDSETLNFRTRFQAPNVAKEIGRAVVSSVLTGGRSIVVKSAMDFGFEYYFIQGQLIIKSYLINNKLNGKMFIHSVFNSAPQADSYYRDLNACLFKVLENNGANLSKKEVEKINDGFEGRNFMHTLKIIALCFGPIILFFVLMILLHQ